ncbi:MAG: DUF5343 domain-containing protein [Phycisphaeraceae bacterium]|nr:DUF5343 domain-containing protein [Phycisphaeraceae bacterium]
MGLPESYVNNVGNLVKFLDQIRAAGVPDRVTVEFLKTLGFKSSNDRPIIAVLKGIGFLDANGTPTDAYRAFRDPHGGPKVLARALRTAYSDLFLANTKAHELPVDKLKGIIATKTSKGETVVKLIAATFKALCKAADFSEPLEEVAQPPTQQTKKKHDKGVDDITPPPPPPVGVPGFHYNIQIHLPTTTDITVYNAIFKSLKEHLLS